MAAEEPSCRVLVVDSEWIDIRSTAAGGVWHREDLVCMKGGAPMKLIRTRSAAVGARPFRGGTQLAG
jgi:hypothetical protein